MVELSTASDLAPAYSLTDLRPALRRPFQLQLAMKLRIRGRMFDTSSRPLVMGILNVTPDSFSDGALYQRPRDAVLRVSEMVDAGADLIDVGPESTRPGARCVAPEEQIKRAVPVIRAIRDHGHDVPISIDTRCAEVATAALDAGADMVNDVSAMRDDEAMVGAVARAGVPIVLMHRMGDAATMQQGGGPEYQDCVGQIRSFLRERAALAEANGVDPSNIILDPGIGFGKRVEHNLQIMNQLHRFTELGYPLLVGASRKSVIGQVLVAPGGAESSPPADRLYGSLACVAVATLAGASIIRVHDVRESVDIARMCAAVRRECVDRVDDS